jgi:exopolysaccharide biosynthesis polyprenyl glycosylphosphotransferase
LQPGRSWRFTQAIADFATVFLAAFGSYWVYIASGFGRSDFNPELYARIDLTIAALTTFAMHAYGAYAGHLGLLRIESARRVLRAVFAGVFLMFAASFFLQSVGFSRLHMLLAGPFMALGLLGQRVTLWRVQAALRARGGRHIPVLVYGAGTTGRVLAQQLLDEHAIGLEPVGFLDDSPELKLTTVRVGPGLQGVRLPVFGGGDELEEVLLLSGASAVFLATPSAPSAHIAGIVARLERLGIPFYGVPSSGNMLLSTLSFGQIGSIPVFTRRTPPNDQLFAVLKRLIDLIGAATLLAVTSPLIVIAAIAVRLTSPGPVYFRQTRIGLGGRPFTIFKLRTMVVDTPVYAEHPRSGGDPRVTPIGRFLRRTCIDELPQLWNVLRGEMSLVGPRPEMPQIVAGYSEMERQRLAAKPGVTGLWQISADRAFRIHDNMHYDLYYIEHRALSMDLAILLMTPFVMMGRGRAV